MKPVHAYDTAAPFTGLEAERFRKKVVKVTIREWYCPFVMGVLMPNGRDKTWVGRNEIDNDRVVAVEEVTDVERLQLMVDDPYYSKFGGGGYGVKQRFDSGDLKIELLEKNWRDEWYSDPHFNVSVPLALEIAAALPDVKVFRIYYRPEHDFHHVQFDYEGETYVVRWYKVFSVYRKSDGKDCSFGRASYDIAGWFRHGKHKEERYWSGGFSSYHPFTETK